MVEGDIFREVEEDLRREQLARAWNRYGTYVLLTAGLIIAGAAGYNIWKWWDTKRAAEGGAAFVQALQLAEDGKTAEMTAAMNTIIKEQGRGYALLAKLQLAAVHAKEGRSAEASALYDQVANDGFADSNVRDYATIQWATINVDTAAEDAIRKRLTPLNLPGNHWRHSARELLGLAAYKAGKGEDAEQHFQDIAADPEAPEQMRRRAQTMLALIIKTPKASAQATQ